MREDRAIPIGEAAAEEGVMGHNPFVREWGG
jgi:hypothetical protein